VDKFMGAIITNHWFPFALNFRLKLHYKIDYPTSFCFVIVSLPRVLAVGDYVRPLRQSHSPTRYLSLSS